MNNYEHQTYGEQPLPIQHPPTPSSSPIKVVNSHTYNVKLFDASYTTPLLFLGTLFAYVKLGGREDSEFLRYPLGAFASLYVFKNLFDR